MKSAVLLALLGAGVCLGTVQAQAQYAQFEVSNLTLSGGDPVFPVTDDVTFQNLTLTEKFADNTTQNLTIPGSLDAFTLLADSTPFQTPDPVHGAISSATLSGNIDLTSLTLQTAFGGSTTFVTVTNPAFSATLTTPSIGTNTNFAVATSGGSVNVGAFSLVASAVPEPGTIALLAACIGVAPLILRRRKGMTFAATLLTLGIAGMNAGAQITANNWGSVTSPVFGSAQAGTYVGAELFAGPNQFGNYYAGVLPNGRKVTPAGTTIQIGMNPLGTILTPDGRFLITSNDDEREGGFASLQSIINKGGYSLSVIDTTTMQVVSQIASGRIFVGLQITGTGPYTLWASGGASSADGSPGVIRLFNVSNTGVITVGTPGTISINPLTSPTSGRVNNYNVDPAFNTNVAPSAFSKAGAKITFPAGSALSPDGKTLYVACNGDNSLAVIDTTTNTVIKQLPVGYFPYDVKVSRDGTKVMVSNWGITDYLFAHPTYVGPNLTALGTTGTNEPDGYYVPVTNIAGSNPKTSSVSIISVPGANPANAAVLGAIYEGQPTGLDDSNLVGDTHPSATAIVRRGAVEVLYVAKSNSDSLGVILVNNNRKLADVDLSLGLSVPVNGVANAHKVHGTYPTALAASADGLRLYVAESGLNSVAVLDTTNPQKPTLLGRIPTDWYPTALSLSADGKTLYIANAKGIGEDINPATSGNPTATGIESYSDGNFIFGSLQKVYLPSTQIENTTVLANNFIINTTADTAIVPIGGSAGSAKIKHVIFILHENKTFDSMMGNQTNHFGAYASLTYNNTGSTTAPNGLPFTNKQYTGVALNTQLLATTFAAGVNYYSDSEESDAGHQFCASGTSSDYTQKTLLVKSGRGLLVNKNFEPEDYPEGGYIFNNAARNGVSFKDYGAFVRIEGTDTGTGVTGAAGAGNTKPDDPLSGVGGVPSVDASSNIVLDGSGRVVNLTGSDVTTATQGLGQSYFLSLPILKILGDNNPSGEPRLDHNYPGYNFNISDQRRALEFNKDFDRMLAAGTLPQFIYLYQPNDHTGGVNVNNPSGISGINLIADGDVGLGMVIDHIMKTSAYYDSTSDTGSAIFVTWDDAQSSLDHIHQHRTPLLVISPFAKVQTNATVGNGYVAKKHYSTASIVKTEELLLGLPPNNLGDLFATDLRDMFQSSYNGITAAMLEPSFTKLARYVPSAEGKKIWALVKNLDTSAPDRDSHRLGVLSRLQVAADDLHKAAVKKNHLNSSMYKATQARLYKLACNVVKGSAPRDADD